MPTLKKNLKKFKKFKFFLRCKKNLQDWPLNTCFTCLVFSNWILFLFRILRGGPATFSRILRSGDTSDSLSRILRSETATNLANSGDDEKQRLSRILRTPEFSRLLRSQTFSRILKRSGSPDEEEFLLVKKISEFFSNFLNDATSDRFHELIYALRQTFTLCAQLLRSSL